MMNHLNHFLIFLVLSSFLGEASLLLPKGACRVKYIKRFREHQRRSTGTYQELEKVMFFDLDDTLYRRSTGVSDQMHRVMAKYIREHVQERADLTNVEASLKKAAQYYEKHGLTIKGILTEKPTVDPKHFEEYVNSQLRLEEMLQRNEQVHRMLGRMSKARKWILTNAGWTHAERTIKILGLVEHFEGVVHCDYGEPGFPAKPDVRKYERAMEAVGPAVYYFADDNLKFVQRARYLGWRSVHVDEELLRDSHFGIKYIENLPKVFPELFDE